MNRQNVETCRPLLTRFAEPRIDSPELPGRYSADLDVWAIDRAGVEIPIVEMGLSTISGEPVTKVERERDKIELCPLLEMTTKTAYQVESDDHTPTTLTALPELTTKTDAIRERDDEWPPPKSSYLLELVTKTLTTQERDD